MSDLLNLLGAQGTTAFDPVRFGALILASLALGCILAALYERRYGGSGGLIVTLALLPATVQTVIMLVNGNVGTGVAVAGAFSLVRFRSVPGTATEIGAVFVAMALGLGCAMGQVVCAAMLLGASVALVAAAEAVGLGRRNGGSRLLKVTLPEGTDWDGLLDDLFRDHGATWELTEVRTSHLGSLIDLRYRVRFRGGEMPATFLDAVRTRNGNLPVSCAKVEDGQSL
ncbi:DUF4956 domain-containing protein [Caniella muris]|uniref:DUF4956 domain-containing protein n=1 Tax=Caniella muris TaxID=2941502 RepID=UPI00203CD67A|nr:DUF4956 domain-containing protein [Caniella muris]